MSTGIIVLLCILGAFVLLVSFMIVRTLLIPAYKPTQKDYAPRAIDIDKVTAKLVDAVKIPTVTVVDEGQSYAPFDDFQLFLTKAFPLIFANSKLTIVNGHAIVLEIKGTDHSLLPCAFCAHQDVVPAPADGWEVPPFDGIIKDGFVYGRGSADMKGQLISNMQGLEILLQEGKKPKRTVYFCLGFDEEYTGINGAKRIAQWLYEQNIRLEFLIDEGGTILNAQKAGIDGYVAMIGVCEKGYVDYKLTTHIPGGHASSPAKHGSVDSIAQAVYNLNNIPRKAYWSKPLIQTVKSVVPYVKNFFVKFILANRDIFSPLILLVGKNVHPVANSAFRTTFAFTQLQGSDAPNVIPKEASAVVNVRINTGETQETVLNHIRKVVGKKVDISVVTDGYDPSPVSPVDTVPYKILCDSITDVFEKHYPVPYCFIAATDAKHYSKVCDNIYRFTPFEVTTDDQHRIHALNERCNIEALGKATEFFAHFIEKTCM